MHSDDSSISLVGWIERKRNPSPEVRSTLNFGIQSRGATVIETTLPGTPTGKFFSWLGQPQYVRRVYEDWEILLRSDLQLANKPLFQMEQIAFGGLGSVRGYRTYLTVTDDGFLARANCGFRSAGCGSPISLIPMLREPYRSCRFMITRWPGTPTGRPRFSSRFRASGPASAGISAPASRRNFITARRCAMSRSATRSKVAGYTSALPRSCFKLTLDDYRRVLGKTAVSATLMDPTHFGAEQVSEEDRAYRGSRFAEVHDALFANPYQKVWGGTGEPPLPNYEVTLRSVLRGVLPFGPSYFFRQAVARAVDSKADLRWGPDRKGFRRIIHPNGICLTGLWQITEETGYSGYFRAGIRALAVGRYSTCCKETRRGRQRSLSLVGKLFPTTDPDHAEPLR